MNCFNVNNALNMFNNILTSTFNKHVPLKKKDNRALGLTKMFDHTWIKETDFYVKQESQTQQQTGTRTNE